MTDWPRCSRQTADGKCGHPLPERIGVYSQAEIDTILTHYEEGRLIDGQALAAAYTAFNADETNTTWVALTAALDALTEEGDQSIESATLAEFVYERQRAHQKHGENSQEGNDWDSGKSLTILVEEVGEVAKVFNERDLGNLTDAQAQQELRKELIQTGAMCLVWIINIEAVTEESDEGKLIRWCFEHEERPVTSLSGREMSCSQGRSFPPFDQTSCRIDFLSTEDPADD